MKIFLAFYLVLAGDPAPHQGQVEVASLAVCRDQLGKLMSQPLPENYTSIQYSCVVHKTGEPT